MVTAQRAVKLTMMARAQRDTMTTTMAMEVYDDNDKGNDARSTTCDEADNRNRDDGEDTCALMATTPAH